MDTFSILFKNNIERTIHLEMIHNKGRVFIEIVYMIYKKNKLSQTIKIGTLKKYKCSVNIIYRHREHLKRVYLMKRVNIYM